MLWKEEKHSCNVKKRRRKPIVNKQIIVFMVKSINKKKLTQNLFIKMYRFFVIVKINYTV